MTCPVVLPIRAAGFRVAAATIIKSRELHGANPTPTRTLEARADQSGSDSLWAQAVMGLANQETTQQRRANHVPGQHQSRPNSRSVRSHSETWEAPNRRPIRTIRQVLPTRDIVAPDRGRAIRQEQAQT